ncbi:MAG: hypothetical protein KAW41_01020 [Candidatus Diapherotrites archaeon]|nr:hypothetical protein [Candidatus Diapherotrites archaeon]
MKGLSGKELEMVSFLELKEKYFFTRSDVRRFFKSENEMNVYLHRLKKKERIVKLNRSKYFLVPVKAFGGFWAEHPLVIIDEIFNGENYFIRGMAAAHYWGLIDQIPTQVEVACTNKQGKKKIFGFIILFKRVRPASMKGFVKRKIGKHPFRIMPKKGVEEWLKSR